MSADAVSRSSPMTLRRHGPTVSTFRALAARNYRLFFFGQGTSLIGTWMQKVALGWLVYRLTGSPLLLGTVEFASQIPNLVLMPIAGVLADRHDRRTILLLTQCASLGQAAVLSVLTLGGWVTVWQVVLLALFLGVVNSFDMPVRQAFVVDMVERKEHMSNAIALNSFLFNGARFIGPSLAGLVIVAFGEGVCFGLNAASYLAIIVVLALMTVPRRPPARDREGIVTGLADGLRYAASSPAIRPMLLLVAFFGLVGAPYIVFLPVLARDVLGGGARTLGFLFSGVGVGALTGAVYLASRPSVAGLSRLVPVATALFGGALTALTTICVCGVIG